MAAASPSGRKRNITQYDFLDEPIVAPTPASPVSSFALNFPIVSPGLRLSRDAGELFYLFFKHNLKPDINFTHREFEKKRGGVPQKTLESAFEVLQLAHKGHANSQQLLDRYADSASTISKDCCEIVKGQLSKHTNFQEDRIQAAAQREEGRQKDRVRYDEAHQEERQRVDAEYCELVMTLDVRYGAELQWVPPNEEQREERKKQIRREVLLQQLAVVQKRRADRRTARKEKRDKAAAAAQQAAASIEATSVDPDHDHGQPGDGQSQQSEDAPSADGEAPEEEGAEETSGRENGPQSADKAGEDTRSTEESSEPGDEALVVPPVASEEDKAE